MMVRYSILWFPAILLTLLFSNFTELSAQPTTTDIAVQEILVPGDLIPPGQPMTAQFSIVNLGSNPAQNFFCVVAIAAQSNPSTPIYQNQINVPLLGPDQTVTLQATQPWLPPSPGGYIIQVGAVYQFDNSPTNNQMGKEFQVDAPGLLTLQQAVDILNEQVLDNHPRVDSLVAIHISPPANPADSLIPPGLTIISADSSFSFIYDYPVYFFFVDLFPDHLFSHPVEYVAVSAIDGTIDRHIEPELWPEINGVTPDFGPYCFGDANPRRVRGGAQQCVEKANPYEPKATSNTGAWGLVVVGKLNLDIEKSTIQHDMCKWKERINGNPLGPGVTGGNINVHLGDQNCGLTEKELCDAIDALKGKGCDKVYFKYIGHGTESGIIVWDKNHKNSSTLSWTKLAKKLKDAGFAEVCLEITACHSGAAIAALKREGIKGTVITSSSASRTTPVGDGSGTYWEKALEACSKDPMADLNRNGKIDACELYAWVKVRGGDGPNGPNPQIEKLNDTTKFVSAKSERVGTTQTISTNGGSIKVYAERICMKLKVKMGNRQRDSTVYRGSVYIENDGNSDKNADRDYKITARCGKSEVVIVERIRPSLRKGEKQCIADFPNDCTGIKVERLRNGTSRKDEEENIILSAAPDASFSTVDETAAHNPNDFIFYRYIYQWDDVADPHTVMGSGPSGWGAAAGPSQFFIPDDSTEDVMTGALIPDSATVGGTVASTIVNTATNDTLQVRYNVLLLDTLGTVNTDETLEGSGRWYDTDGSALLKGFRAQLNNVHIEASDSLLIEAVGDWNWKDVIVNADSGTFLATGIGLGTASSRWENVVVRGAGGGVVAQAGNVSMRNVTVGASSGFTFIGNRSLVDTVLPLRLDTLAFLNVIGANNDGIVFKDINAKSAGADTTTLRWLRVEFVDQADVVVMENSHLRCVDCMYRDSEVLVDATSSLGRYATLSMVAVDTAGIGLAGIDVAVVDSLGQTIYSGKTSADGFLPNMELLLSSYDANGYRSYQPFVITASNGIAQLTDTLRLTTYRQRIFEFDQGPSSSVPVAGEKNRGASIIRTLPQPMSRGDELVVETTGLGTGNVGATIHNALGETVWSDENISVTNDRAVLREFGANIQAGIYILRLHLADGGSISTKIVVQ